jgi:hypothetical protein
MSQAGACDLPHACGEHPAAGIAFPHRAAYINPVGSTDYGDKRLAE